MNMVRTISKKEKSPRKNNCIQNAKKIRAFLRRSHHPDLIQKHQPIFRPIAYPIFGVTSSENHLRIFAGTSCRVQPGKPSGLLVAGREQEQFVHLPIFGAVSLPGPAGSGNVRMPV
jgi:hypothetical protein